MAPPRHPDAPAPAQQAHTSHPAPPLGSAETARVQSLVDFYRRVQAERMQGIPILNAALAVQAVGFQAASKPPDTAAVLEGVLITPWFMSLIRLPAAVQDHGGRVTRKTVHHFGNERFEFIGAHDPSVGYHESCALFSPMGSFLTQAQARETAQAVLAQLRPAPPSTPAPEPVPARRAFFMARRPDPAPTRP